LEELAEQEEEEEELEEVSSGLRGRSGQHGAMQIVAHTQHGIGVGGSDAQCSTYTLHSMVCLLYRSTCQCASGVCLEQSLHKFDLPGFRHGMAQHQQHACMVM
jgi:hypothetical protein